MTVTFLLLTFSTFYVFRQNWRWTVPRGGAEVPHQHVTPHQTTSHSHPLWEREGNWPSAGNHLRQSSKVHVQGGGHCERLRLEQHVHRLQERQEVCSQNERTRKFGEQERKVKMRQCNIFCQSHVTVNMRCLIHQGHLCVWLKFCYFYLMKKSWLNCSKLQFLLSNSKTNL